MKYHCPKCHHTIYGEARYCGDCGTRLQEVSERRSEYWIIKEKNGAYLGHPDTGSWTEDANAAYVFPNKKSAMLERKEWNGGTKYLEIIKIRRTTDLIL